ncbi:hypothetical protein LXL04_004628 [Taraxacum kok-saghyz]
MKHIIRSSVPLISFLFLIVFSHTSARCLYAIPGDHKISEESFVELETTNSLNELMGMEECGSGDEECLKRRVLGEAHLDYIYTQHRKP